MVWRGMSIIWIGLSLVVQVFAVTALFDAWELFDTAWREPFYTLGKYYAIAVNLIADNLGGLASGLLAQTSFGENIALPCWWVHVLAMYGAAASAIWAGSMSRDERNNRISQVKRGGFSIMWPIAIAGLILQGARNRVVSKFLARHSNSALLYGVATLAAYAGANWVNASVFEGAPPAGQEVQLVNDVKCPMVMRDGVPVSLQDLLPDDLRDAAETLNDIPR